MSYCHLCDKFFHTPKNCHSLGSVNSIQGVVATLSQAVSEPTPRILGTAIQNVVQKGEITILPDSGSVAEVLPVYMPSTVNLS